jgi:hypothetical protein
LAQDMLRALLGKLSPDLSSTNFVTPLSACAPLYSDQVTQTRLLREIPTLDETSIAVRQKDDNSEVVQIPGMDAIGDPGDPSTGLDASKGKSKVAMLVHSDDEVSSDDDQPL